MTPFRAEVDNPIGCLNNVQIVFNYDHGIPAIPESVQYLQQLANIVKVESSCGFIQYIQCATGISF